MLGTGDIVIYLDHHRKPFPAIVFKEYGANEIGEVLADLHVMKPYGTMTLERVHRDEKTQGPETYHSKGAIRVR